MAEPSYERYAKLLSEKSVTSYRVAQETGVTQTTLSDWKTGRAKPKAATLKKIADYFGVTVDYFVGEERKAMAGSYKAADSDHINRYKMAHMIGVAEYMSERADDYGLDSDVMYTFGLLHDIGYLDGHKGHEENGAAILEAMGMNDDLVYAIQHHGENMYDVPESKVTPEMVLLIEADMSINAQGYRVGFEGRLEDIKDRYGDDSIAAKTVEDNIAFVKEWQAEHNIDKPYNLYHKNHNRGEGR